MKQTGWFILGLVGGFCTAALIGGVLGFIEVYTRYTES